MTRGVLVDVFSLRGRDQRLVGIAETMLAVGGVEVRLRIWSDPSNIRRKRPTDLDAPASLLSLTTVQHHPIEDTVIELPESQ